MIKARIVAKYFDAWAKVIIPHRRGSANTSKEWRILS
jgi:hypothetical protein